MISYFAEFERALINERQREGSALAKQRGAYKGRKKALSAAAITSLLTISSRPRPSVSNLSRSHRRCRRGTVLRTPNLVPGASLRSLSIKLTVPEKDRNRHLPQQFAFLREDSIREIGPG
jgi:hypothetical protein